jgi:hypothetical protein
MFFGEPLSPTEFHLHWHYNKGAGPLPSLDDRYFVRDPAVLRSAIRQKVRGNQRIPSTHEHRNAEIEQKAQNAQAAVQAV